MPELPEVETVARGLRPRLEGHRLARVELLDPRLTLPFAPADVARQLQGLRVERVWRRGKYLLWQLEGDLVAIHHLRMTGKYTVDDATAGHVRAVYEVDGATVRYHDLRRFGTLRVLPGDEAAAFLDARLGPEPLDEAFTPQVLRRALQRRTAPVKAALLDQRVVAGLGNIYVDEALFQARIAPQTPAHEVSAVAARRLRDAIVDRLQVAITAKGSTLRDYRTVAGGTGGMQRRFRVYGRGGKPCLECGRTLARGTVGGRTTVWCASCQPTVRRRRSG